MAVVKNIVLTSLLLVLYLLIALIPSCTHMTQQIQTNVTKQTVFSVANLHTQPLRPQPDETFTFAVTVINSGDKQVSYDATLYIIELEGQNEIQIGTLVKSVTVAAGGSEIVTFGQMHLPGGEYKVVIDDLINIIKVKCT